MATQSENPAEVAEELETHNEVENHSERPAETAEDHNSPLMTAMKLLARQMNILQPPLHRRKRIRRQPRGRRNLR